MQNAGIFISMRECGKAECGNYFLVVVLLFHLKRIKEENQQ
jgi:hypothetical protein